MRTRKNYWGDYWYLGDGPYLFSPHLLSMMVKMRRTRVKRRTPRAHADMMVASMGDAWIASTISEAMPMMSSTLVLEARAVKFEPIRAIADP